jgi:hypothetical protein
VSPEHSTCATCNFFFHPFAVVVVVVVVDHFVFISFFSLGVHVLYGTVRVQSVFVLLVTLPTALTPAKRVRRVHSTLPPAKQWFRIV